MRNKLLLLAGLVLSFAYPTTGADKSGSPETKLFTISGKIINTNSTSTQRTVRFIFSDLFTRTASHLATIDSSGSFSIAIPVPYVQDFYLDFKDLCTLIAVPGQNLTVEIDASLLNDRNKARSFVSITGGSAGATNQNMLLFSREKPDQKYIYSAANKAVETKSPEEYKEYIRQREQEYTIFAKEFNKKNKTTPVFRQWLNDNLQYESLADLMRYPWLHQLYHPDIQNFNLPDNYYSFTGQAQEPVSGIMSANHINFMNDYYSYVREHPAEKYELALKTFKTDGFLGGSRIFLENIRLNTKGLNREICLSKYYFLVLENKKLAEFEALYTPEDIIDPYLTQRITDFHGQLQKAINGSVVSVPLKSIGNPALDGLIDTICSRYKGKVIYIGFWGVHCGPCRQEMPFSKTIQAHFAGKDVVFLYLSQPTSEKLWKSTISGLGISGENFLLTEDQYNVLSTGFGITGVPHYALVDKEGNITNKNALRPSEQATLIREIQKLLEQ